MLTAPNNLVASTTAAAALPAAQATTATRQASTTKAVASPAAPSATAMAPRASTTSPAASPARAPTPRNRSRGCAVRIRDLSDPVTASKADWSLARECLSFTPTSDSRDAANKCQSAVLKQIGRGYVLEYITKGMERPNPGFEDDDGYKESRRQHEIIAGTLQAVHR